MSRQTTLYVIAFAAIISVGLLTSYFTRHSLDPREIQPVLASGPSAPTLVPQRSNERTWRAFAFQKMFSIDELTQPEIVKVGFGDDILVLDWSDLRIKRFSSQGQLKGYYGKGKGKEPGQFVTPTDFTATSSGQLWVADPDGGITVFDQSGELIETISPKNAVQRIVHGDGGRFVAMRSSRSSDLWQAYSGDGTLQKNFGRLIEDQSEHAISLQGWIEGDGSSIFYYAPLYAGLLASYSFDGECQFFVQTIDSTLLPKIQITEEGSKRVADRGAISTLSISVSGDEIYLLTQVASNNAKRNVLDVYSKNDGFYLYSIEMPEPCRQAYIKDDYAYTLHEKSVAKWKLKSQAL